MDLMTQLKVTLISWLLLAGPVLGLGLLLWFSLPARRRQLLPLQRHYLVPWSGWETFLIFLGLGILPAVMLLLLISTLGEPTESEKLLYSYAAYALSFPVHIGISLLLLYWASGTQLYQLGLHTSRWRQGVLLGCLVWLVATPLISGLHLAVEWAYLQWMGKPSQSHELVRLIDQGINPALELTLFLLAPLVIAPVLEEFIFRGVIQRWAGNFVWRGHLVMFLAILGVLLRGGEMKPETVGLAIFLLLLVPVYHFCPLFVGWAFSIPNLVKGSGQRNDVAKENRNNSWQNDREGLDIRRNSPGDWWLDQMDAMINPARQDPRVTRPRAIFATAALFAGVHSWPTPIPLFFLGLLLGWVSYRTQGLVAPVILHFLFNAVACISVVLTF